MLFGVCKSKLIDKLYYFFIFCIFLVLHKSFSLLRFHPYQRQYDLSLLQTLLSAFFDHFSNIIESLDDDVELVL